MEEENKIGNIESISNENTLVIKSEDSPFAESFYFIEIYDEKALKKFIKSTERLIRTSKEYSYYIEQLRTNITALNHDNIQINITTSDADLEIHHYPFTLYEIVEAVVSHNIQNDIKITTFRVAKEVMDCHVKQMIGLVSLTHTNHELAHCGKLFLSKNQIFGDYNKFIEKYKDGISVNLLQKVNTMEQMSKENKKSDFTGIYKN